MEGMEDISLGSLNTKGATPLPWKTMTILCSVILSEPISMTILFPFVFFMVKDFGYEEKDIGFYVGFIASSFSFAQFLTSMGWGFLSDRIGRRPVLLLGLIGNSLSTCCFGLSKSLIWAILSRASCGLLNGNIGVAKCVLGEITDKSNQGKAFALIGLNYGIGLIIGPMLGGLLSHPAENFPLIFGSCEFLSRYPYFLPCFVSSLISTAGFISGYYLLPETCKNLHGYQRLPLDPEQSLQNVEERDEQEEQIDLEQDIQRTETITEIEEEVGHSLLDNSPGLGMNAIASAIAYSLLAFQSIIFAEVFPLWAVSPQPVGISFTSSDIGFLFSGLGILTVICQAVLYPKASSKYSPLVLFKYPIVLLAIVIGAFPLISSQVPQQWVWPAVSLAMGCRSILESFIFTSVMILINNSAKPGQLGLVNGIAQGAAAASRAIGPAFGGSVWAWSGQNGLGFPFDNTLVFWIAVLIIVTLTIQSWIMLK